MSTEMQQTFKIEITAENTLLAVQRVLGILSRGRIPTRELSFRSDGGGDGDLCSIHFICEGGPTLLQRVKAQCGKIIEVKTLQHQQI